MNVWKVRPDLMIRGIFWDRPNKIQELEDLGVTMVICMLRKYDQDLENLINTSDRFEYLNYPIADAKGPVPPGLSVSRAYEAAESAAVEISSGGKVLIHCIGSRDRAPFTAALTLHLLEGISGAEAMLRIRGKKKTTFYNEGYKNYLLTLKGRDDLSS